MAQRMVYGIFIPKEKARTSLMQRSGGFAISFSKSEAIKFIKSYGEGEVRAMPYGLFNDSSSWDRPTFRLQSKKIYPK